MPSKYIIFCLIDEFKKFIWIFYGLNGENDYGKCAKFINNVCNWLWMRIHKYFQLYLKMKRRQEFSHDNEFWMCR